MMCDVFDFNLLCTESCDMSIHKNLHTVSTGTIKILEDYGMVIGVSKF